MAGTVRVKNDAGAMNVAAMAGNILAELLSGMRMQDSSLVAGTGDIDLKRDYTFSRVCGAVSDSLNSGVITLQQ